MPEAKKIVDQNAEHSQNWNQSNGDFCITLNKFNNRKAMLGGADILLQLILLKCTIYIKILQRKYVAVLSLQKHIKKGYTTYVYILKHFFSNSWTSRLPDEFYSYKDFIGKILLL